MIDGILNVSQREYLCDYWNDLPIVTKMKRLADPDSKGAVLRNQIMVTIGEGVFDKIVKKQRRGLSVNEIFKIIRKGNSSVTKPNIYYHISKLVDGDYLTCLLKVKNGRNVTSYFGRNAQLYFFNNAYEFNDSDAEVHAIEFRELLNSFNQKKLLKIDPQLDSFFIDENFDSEFFEWIKDKKKYFEGIEVNLYNLFSLFQKIRYQQENGQLLNKIGNILQIKSSEQKHPDFDLNN